MEHTAICTPSFALAKSLPSGQGLASLMLSILPLGSGGPAMPEGCNLQLFPDGEFAATDGRPGSDPKNAAKAWRLDAVIAAELLADLAAQKTPRLVDYEHQTIHAEINGQPAPAAGWMRNYTYAPGSGLFAFADWTAKAKTHIEAGEYRFISPVFSYCRKTGRVVRLLHAALTNFPALDGMAQVAASVCALPASVAAVSAGSFFSPTANNNFLEEHMDEFLKKMRALLGLPDTADEAAVCKALEELKNGSQAAQAALKAASAQGDAHLAALAALQTQMAALSKRDSERELDAVIAAAKREGKLTAALEPWARDLGGKDLAALTAYLEKVPAIDALKGGTQTDGKTPKNEGDAALTAEDKYMAQQFGMSEEDYAKMVQGGK